MDLGVEMVVEFRCPFCRRRLSADSRSTGAKLKCPRCGQLASVPTGPVETSLDTRPERPLEGPSETSLAGPPEKPLAGRQEASLFGRTEMSRSHPGEPLERDQRQADPIRFPSVPLPDDRLDMTPMIDCVFLLLIFYVVTATFAYQKALEMPTPESSSAAQAKHLEEILESDDTIIIRVDKESVLWVNESEVRTRQDLLVKLRAALQKPLADSGRRPTQLMVLADPDARHEAVIMALDAGNAVGMEQIRLATVPEEEF